MRTKTPFVVAALCGSFWIPSAHSQLALGDAIGIDFGTIAPADGLNFNQFDGNTNPIPNGGILAFSDQDGAPTEMINTAGMTVAGVGFTLENLSGQSTDRAVIDIGTVGPVPFDDPSIFSDALISNNTNQVPLSPGGFLVLTFSGLDSALAYDLTGGFEGLNNNFDTTWTAGGTSILSAPGNGYVSFSGLSADANGNLVITLTRSSLHVNVGALTLTAVTPTAAVDSDNDGIADSFEENFFPDDPNPLDQLDGNATGPGPGCRKRAISTVMVLPIWRNLPWR